MAFWSKLFRRERSPSAVRYGLSPENPILCGGGPAGEHHYLKRLRCPSGTPITFQRRGSIGVTDLRYLNAPGVHLDETVVTTPAKKKMIDESPEMVIDGYQILCGCGNHSLELFMDMYHRGQDQVIDVALWTLVGEELPEVDQHPPCPYCGKPLRTPRAKQCRHCGKDWHS